MIVKHIQEETIKLTNPLCGAEEPKGSHKDQLDFSN